MRRNATSRGILDRRLCSGNFFYARAVDRCILRVQRDADGSIRTGHEVDKKDAHSNREPLNFETSVAGIYAVGDVRLGSMKRLASAVGEGAGAVQNIHEYLEELQAKGPETKKSATSSRMDAA